MITVDFEYYVPRDLGEAVGLLARYGAEVKVLAGGTDLIVALQKGEVAPRALMDVREIRGMKSIRVENGALVVGAAVTFAQLMEDPRILKTMPLLGDAAAQIGSPQVRNRGTIGGNIGTACPAGDLLTPLVALGAEVRLLNARGERSVFVGKLLEGGTQDRLGPDELIEEVRVPLFFDNPRAAFVKLGRRNAQAVSRLNLAMCVDMKPDGTVVAARLAVGAAGPVPFRVTRAEEALVRGESSPLPISEVMERVSDAAVASLGDRPSAAFKARAVMGMAWEALERCGLV